MLDLMGKKVLEIADKNFQLFFTFQIKKLHSKNQKKAGKQSITGYQKIHKRGRDNITVIYIKFSRNQLRQISHHIITILQTYIQYMIVALLTTLAAILLPANSLGCDAGFTSSGPLGLCTIKGCANQQVNKLCEPNNCLKGFRYSEPGLCYAEKCVDKAAVQCEKCIEGFELSYEISPNVRICAPKNCESSSNLQCIKCQRLYERTDMKGCVPSMCSKYDQDTSCIQCRKGFYPQNGVCVAETCTRFNQNSNKCSQCAKGYIPDDTEICLREDSLCINYSNITGLCGACKKGFRLVGLIKCVRENDLCFEYGLDGCIRCITGYEAKNNTCVSKGCRQAYSENPRQCVQCQFGYVLDQDRKCRASNCVQFNTTLWTCLKCEGRYTLNLTSGMCVTKNCSLFDRTLPSMCIFCNPEYLLINGQCYLMHCKTPKAQTCSQCDQGWLMNENSNCIIRECLTYVGTKCASCKPGKRLLRGECVADNCLLRIPGGVCLQCSSDYFSSKDYPNICVPHFCSQFNPQTGQCFGCFPNFELQSNGFCKNSKCKAFELIPGYVHPQCTSCQLGYRAQDRYCIPNRCDFYDLQTATCQNCLKKYELKVVPGYPDFPKVCINFNCQQFTKSLQSQCLSCKSGYKYNKTADQCQPLNCTSTKTDQSGKIECQKCVDKFTLAFGICLTINCLTFDSDGVCAQCLAGHFLMADKTCQKILCAKQENNRCIKCQKGYFISSDGSCKPYNCKSQTNKVINGVLAPVCGSCIDGFVPEGNYCVAKNCGSLSTNFSCSSCRKQYEVVDNICQFKPDILTYCLKSEYFDKTQFFCKPIKVANCEYVDSDNPNQCLKCKDDFVLVGSVCQSLENCASRSYYTGCLACKTGFQKNKDGNCENIVPYCNRYSEDNRCAQCIENYSLISIPTVRCIETPKSCALLNESGFCIGCRDPVQMVSNNKCIYYSENCVTYHEVYGECTQCKQGYFYQAIKKKCELLPFGCAIATGYGSCATCKIGYVLTNGQCFEQIKNCKVQLSNDCVTCETSYFVTSTKRCERTPLNCVEVNPNGNCQKCKDGYYPLKGVCTRQIEYCQLYESEKRACRQCSQGYSLSENKLFCLFGN